MLRASREWLGLSQHQLADLTAERGIPVSRSAICDIERGCIMPGVESLVSLCEALQLDPREALERVSSSTDLAGDLSIAKMPFDELQRRNILLFRNGQYRASAAVCVAIVEQLEVDPSREPTERRRLCARFEVHRSVALKVSGNRRSAEAAARRALHFAAGAEDLQVEGLVVLAGLHGDEALRALAAAESEQAFRMAQAKGAPRQLGFAWCTRARTLFDSDRLEEAAEAFRRAIDCTIQTGDVCNQSKSEGSLGTCLLHLGHPSAARRRYVKALELAREGGDRGSTATWQIEIGRVGLQMEELDEAERRAAAGLRIARSNDNPLTVFRGIWLQHQIAQRRNSRDPDRHRVAYLKRLYPSVRHHNTTDVIRDFRREVLGSANA